VYVLKCRCTCNRVRCSGGSPALCAIPWAPSHALHEKGEGEREREGGREREGERNRDREKKRKKEKSERVEKEDEAHVRNKNQTKKRSHTHDYSAHSHPTTLHNPTSSGTIPHHTPHYSTPLHATKPYPTPPHLISASLTALQIHPLLFDHGPWTRIRN
jgi:hypothetical protein